MTEEEFKKDFYFTSYGPGLWRIYNRATNQAASPVYNNKDAAIYYVEQELKLEMEEQMDKLLGGTGDITRIHDVDSFYSGLPTTIAGNGSKEKL